MQDFTVPMAQTAALPQQQPMRAAPTVNAPETIDPAGQQAMATAREAQKQKDIFEVQSMQDHARDKALMAAWSTQYNLYDPTHLDAIAKNPEEFGKLSASGQDQLIQRKYSLETQHAKLNEQYYKTTKAQQEDTLFQQDEAVQGLKGLLDLRSKTATPSEFQAVKDDYINQLAAKKRPDGTVALPPAFLAQMRQWDDKTIEDRYKNLAPIVAKRKEQAQAEKAEAEAKFKTTAADVAAKGGKDFYAIEAAQKVIDNVNSTEAEIKAAKDFITAKTSGGANNAGAVTMTPAAIRMEAELLRESGGDPKALTGMSRQRGNMAAIVNEFAKIRESEGITAQDMVEGRSGIKAASSAQTALRKDLASLRPYKEMLDTNSNIVIDLSKKITQTDSKFANKTINWIKQNAGDNPDTAEFLAQMHFVQTEAARVLNNPRLVGQLTDEAKKEMQSVVNGDMPLESMERVVRRMQTDGDNRVNAMLKELERTRSETTLSGQRGGKSTATQDPASAAAIKVDPATQAARDSSPERIKALKDDVDRNAARVQRKEPGAEAALKTASNLYDQAVKGAAASPAHALPPKEKRIVGTTTTVAPDGLTYVWTETGWVRK